MCYVRTIYFTIQLCRRSFFSKCKWRQSLANNSTLKVNFMVLKPIAVDKSLWLFVNFFLNILKVFNIFVEAWTLVDTKRTWWLLLTRYCGPAGGWYHAKLTSNNVSLRQFQSKFWQGILKDQIYVISLHEIFGLCRNSKNDYLFHGKDMGIDVL